MHLCINLEKQNSQVQTNQHGLNCIQVVEILLTGLKSNMPLL